LTESLIAQVAVAAPLEKVLSYVVPQTLVSIAEPGHLLKVSLGRRAVYGYLLSVASGKADGLKEIGGVVDETPLFPAGMKPFFERVAHYYHHPIGEVISTGVPVGLFGSPKKSELSKDWIYSTTSLSGNPTGSRQKEILQWLRDHGSATRKELASLFPSSSQVLKRLVELGFLTTEEKEERDFSSGCITDQEQERPDLSAEQDEALSAILGALGSQKFSSFLLHGVTGSGKTEIYMRAVEEAYRSGRKALVLVPEIALTPQLVGRFRERFSSSGLCMAVLHSGLSREERRNAWKAVCAGQVDVAIGARSAVFAPFDRLGLVIVDEEHDASYKQSEGFRYNARDMALLRAQMDRATVVLGSATPSMAAFQRAREGRIDYLSLKERALSRPLPEVRLIDLALSQEKRALTKELAAALKKNLERKEQSLLLLNRRGFAPFLLCVKCGTAIRCPNCEITLTFYQKKNLLRCHYCDHVAEPPRVCSHCQGDDIRPYGSGTERLEEDLTRLFPEARVARMDSDSMGRKGSYQELISRMSRGEVDILVGTQMISKGHDFENVTLVGVVNADASLFLPDYRSAERTFSLLTQVSGRAGRGVIPGRVLIQTHNPEHYVFKSVTGHDYEAFFNEEIRFREEAGYPPFGFLANLVLSGEKAEKTEEIATGLAKYLRKHAGEVEVLGPAACILSRLRGKYRVQIVLKSSRRTSLHRILRGVVVFQKSIPKNVKMTLDVDPLDMF
jgi:primosomal protein N' (replication factor Y)